MVSGLWHQMQESAQPFKNTVVLIPGPSWVANRMMSATFPVTTPAAPYERRFGIGPAELPVNEGPGRAS